MRVLIALALLGATTAAMAQSASDFVLRSPAAGTRQARAAFVPKLEGQAEALQSRDVTLLCFAEGRVFALVLKVGANFYALNGTARELTNGGEIVFRGQARPVIDPYKSKLEQADYMQRMIGPGNRACETS